MNIQDTYVHLKENSALLKQQNSIVTARVFLCLLFPVLLPEL